MLKLLGKMFGDADVVKKAADGIYNGLDKAIFTKEEKAEFNQKRMELYLKFVEATAPYKIARRYIAIVITCVWALLVVACAILGAIGGFDYQGAAQDYMRVGFTCSCLCNTRRYRWVRLSRGGTSSRVYF